VYDKYKERGLSVVGLAFEMTGEFSRDAEQVRRMRERHKATYPFLLAGLSDKKKAGEAFPALDQVFAFPTTIFLHRDGRVRAVHSGFSGPGTKEEHEKLAKKFEGIIEELLAEPDANEDGVWTELTADAWRGSVGRRLVRFLLDEGGKRTFISTMPESDRLPGRTSTGVVSVRGNTVVLEEEVWRFDPRTRDLIDPRDFGRRLERASRAGWDPNIPFDAALLASEQDPFVLTSLAYEAGRSGLEEAGAALTECTKHGFASLRREAARAIAGVKYKRGEDELRLLLHDFDPLVRKTAEAALARLPNR
jgi:hypothetical protein